MKRPLFIAVLVGFTALCLWIAFGPGDSGSADILDFEAELGRLAGEEANRLRKDAGIHVVTVADQHVGRMKNAGKIFLKGLRSGSSGAVQEHPLEASLDYEGTGEVVSATQLIEVIKSLPKGDVLVSSTGLPRDLKSLQAALAEQDIGFVLATMFDVPPGESLPTGFPDVLIRPDDSEAGFAISR